MAEIVALITSDGKYSLYFPIIYPWLQKKWLELLEGRRKM